MARRRNTTRNTTQRNIESMENCICFNLRRAARAVTQRFDAQMRRHGLRPTQTPILGALRGKGTLSMAALSEWLGIDRTTLVRNLRPLQRDGLVRASGGGRGGRVELELTEKGRAALAHSLPAWRAAQRTVVDTLGQQRWSDILADLEQVAQTLDGE
jgi:DNA-binding MarR family transcriptional regulator